MIIRINGRVWDCAQMNVGIPAAVNIESPDILSLPCRSPLPSLPLPFSVQFAGAGVLGQYALEVFAPSAPGGIILMILLLNIAAWIAAYIANAMGKPQIADLIKGAGIFGSLLFAMTLVGNVLWEMLKLVGIA